MSFVDSQRTRRYKEALKRKAHGATVLDIGTGGNATLAIAALEAKASFVLAFELNEIAVTYAAEAIRKFMGDGKEETHGRGKRVRSGRANQSIVLKLKREIKNNQGNLMTQEIWLVRGDATKTSSIPEIIEKLKTVDSDRVLIVHELFDDFASGEDVVNIISAVQQSLRQVFGEEFLPKSVPDNAVTFACLVSLRSDGLDSASSSSSRDEYQKSYNLPFKKRRMFVESQEEPEPLSGQLTISESAIFTHNQLPKKWYHGHGQPLEKINFESNQLCGLDYGGTTKYEFTFTKPVHGVALSLKIDFGQDHIYDVRDEESSNWRTVIIGIPDLGFKSTGAFSVRMAMLRSADLQMSYSFDFCNAANGKTGKVRISSEDLTSVIMGDSLAAK